MDSQSVQHGQGPLRATRMASRKSTSIQRSRKTPCWNRRQGQQPSRTNSSFGRRVRLPSNSHTISPRGKLTVWQHSFNPSRSGISGKRSDRGRAQSLCCAARRSSPAGRCWRAARSCNPTEKPEPALGNGANKAIAPYAPTPPVPFRAPQTGCILVVGFVRAQDIKGRVRC